MCNLSELNTGGRGRVVLVVDRFVLVVLVLEFISDFKGHFKLFCFAYPCWRLLP